MVDPKHILANASDLKQVVEVTGIAAYAGLIVLFAVDTLTFYTLCHNA